MGRLIAIGDIHGCFDQLQELVESRIMPGKDDRIIFLGDYIDRGDNSREVIDYIIRLMNTCEVIPLRGNHELMLLDAIDDEDNTDNWLWNGGEHTLRSFGIGSPFEMKPVYKDFFRSTEWYHQEGNILFVHAGFNEAESLRFTDFYSMVWIRKESYESAFFRDRIIVHGHTPVPLSTCIDNVNSGKNVINIDTGCVYSSLPGYGKLTALEFPGKILHSV